MTPESSITNLLERKRHIVDTIATSSTTRLKILHHLAELTQSAPQTADVAIVLGTSPKLFPEKFTTRIEHACNLIHNQSVELVVFTGRNDSQSENENQAVWAARVATSKFGLKESDYCLVGGKNTEQNFVETLDELRAWYSWVSSILVVSEGFHLIRSVSLAKHLFGGFNIQVYPSPVDRDEPLNPNDPKIIRELIKALAYNHTIVRPTFPDSISFLRQGIDNIVKEYEMKLFPTSQI